MLRKLGGCVTGLQVGWAGFGPAVGPSQRELLQTGDPGAVAGWSRGNHGGQGIMSFCRITALD